MCQEAPRPHTVRGTHRQPSQWSRGPMPHGNLMRHSATRRHHRLPGRPFCEVAWPRFGVAGPDAGKWRHRVHAAAPGAGVVLAAERATAACLRGAGPGLAGRGQAGGQGGDRRRRGVGAGQVRGRPARSLLRAARGASGRLPHSGTLPAEGVQYVAGFLLGAALAIPAGMVLGPRIAGIAVVVIAGVLVSGWHRPRRPGGPPRQILRHRASGGDLTRSPFAIMAFNIPNGLGYPPPAQAGRRP